MSRVNEHGQPIGDEVPGWTPRPRPEATTLTGRYVVLEPIGPQHAQALLAATADPALWTYRHDEPPVDVDELVARIGEWAASEDTVTFAIVPSDTGQCSGTGTLMRIDALNGSAEVGSVLYGAGLARTRAATEAVALLARYLFDELGYRRFEWKLDSLNEPSARAARRLGFRYEGRFHNALVYKGRNRDTDWFAMTDADWRRLAPAHETWLDPDNFDDLGQQRTALSTLTGPDQRDDWTAVEV